MLSLCHGRTLACLVPTQTVDEQGPIRRHPTAATNSATSALITQLAGIVPPSLHPQAHFDRPAVHETDHHTDRHDPRQDLYDHAALYVKQHLTRKSAQVSTKRGQLQHTGRPFQRRQFLLHVGHLRWIETDADSAKRGSLCFVCPRRVYTLKAQRCVRVVHQGSLRWMETSLPSPSVLSRT